KCKSTKFSRAQQMLKRLALAATLHQIAQWRELGFSQHTLKFQVQLNPFPSEHVREQMLSIQPRIFDAVFLEICCRRLQHFENGHGPLIVIRAKSRNLSVSSDR